MSWNYLKEKVKNGEATFGYGQTTVPGVASVELLLPHIGMPLGFIWFRWGCGNEMEICYVWTHEDMRRAGVANRIFAHLLESFKPAVVSTGQVNEFSKPWCIANGFVYDKARNYWVKNLLPGESESTPMPKSAVKKSRTKTRKK